MTVTTPTSPAPLAELAEQLRGTLHLPDDADYARLVTPWNVAVAAHPLAVAQVADADDVQAVVRFANRHGLSVDVRCTGHGATHDGTGTILVSTVRLDGVSIDDSGVARVGAGVRWGAVIEAASPLGLAPICGSSPHVGVVGLLTGGGVGPLARSFGMCSDRVRAFEVVTGDGELRRATATENPALFWALRGGKGTLGIVTAVEIELVPLPRFLGGAVYFPAEDIPSVLRSWAAWSRDLPDEATTSIAIMRLPEMPGLPPAIAGATTVTVRYAWTGDDAEGERRFADMLAAGTPVLGGIAPMPYASVAAIHADPVEPMPVAEGGALLGGLPDEAVEALLETAGPQARVAPLMVELRLLGGAVARAPRDRDAIDHRDAAYAMNVIGLAAGPIAVESAAAGVRILEAVGPWSTDGALPNFAPREDAEHVRSVYDAATLARLGTLAASYDPHGVIRAAEPVRRALAAVETAPEPVGV